MIRTATVAAAVGLTAACGSTTASQPGSPSPAATATTPAPAAPAPAATTPAPAPRTTSPGVAQKACQQSGAYLTAIRVGQQAGYDRVVFQFSGGMPGYDVDRVSAVSVDPKGTGVSLAGQSYLRVVFRGASATCPQPPGKTYAGPSTLTPFYPELLVVTAAGDFEGYLSFGVGLAAQGGYHVHTLSGPNRVVIDFDHVALGRFPGIWPVTSWQQYWQMQYSWNNGHQPWHSSPALVVEAWARGQWHTAPVMRQVDVNTFKVTAPSGRVYTVTGTRPVTVPGPWVITSIS